MSKLKVNFERERIKAKVLEMFVECGMKNPLDEYTSTATIPAKVLKDTKNALEEHYGLHETSLLECRDIDDWVGVIELERIKQHQSVGQYD